MEKITKAQNDKAIRESVFTMLGVDSNDLFHKINDRQYGILMTDLFGNVRYARVGVIVAENRDDMTAEELMTSEINLHKEKQEAKTEKLKARGRQYERAKKRREAEAEKDDPNQFLPHEVTY